jgi:hypothetical protein
MRIWRAKIGGFDRIDPLMNVFILNAGRSGSLTFIRACRHITNYTCAHESRSGLLGAARLDYPRNHIEADNRLSWFLGRLDRAYGKDAIYVHLRRNPDETAESFARRRAGGIMRAYRKTLLMGLASGSDPSAVARDYCDTVTSNIELFLRDKPGKMDFAIENAREDFRRFWELVRAEGDLDAALAEFDHRYNASRLPPAWLSGFPRLAGWLNRLFRQLSND